MFSSPFVNAFSICGFEVKMYGVVMFCAILTGIFISNFMAKRFYKNVDRDVLFDFLPIMIIFGVIFARLYYVVLNLDYYSIHPTEIPAIWHGGISIHGAILGGILAGLFYFKKRKMPILPYADVISFGLVLHRLLDVGVIFLIRKLLAYLVIYLGSSIYCRSIDQSNIIHSIIFIRLFYMSHSGVCLFLLFWFTFCAIQKNIMPA